MLYPPLLQYNNIMASLIRSLLCKPHAFSPAMITYIHHGQGRRKRQGIGPANTPKQLINYSYFVLRMRRHPPAYMTINNQRQEYINNHLCKMRRQYVAIYSSSEFPKLTEAMFTTSNKLITNCINVELVYFLLIEVEQQ